MFGGDEHPFARFYQILPAFLPIVMAGEPLVRSFVHPGYSIFTVAYHLVMTNRSPWKIHPFFSSVNHRTFYGPSKNHGKLLVITRGYVYIYIYILYIYILYIIYIYYIYIYVHLSISISNIDASILYIDCGIICTTNRFQDRADANHPTPQLAPRPQGDDRGLKTTPWVEIAVSFWIIIYNNG